MESVTQVFVYGTLKRPFAQNQLMRHCSFISEAELSNHRMMSLSHFPGIVPFEGFDVKGELYKLPDVDPDSTIRALDSYEGEGYLYKRSVVQTSMGPAFTYIYMGSGSVNPFWIDSGEWLKAS